MRNVFNKKYVDGTILSSTLIESRQKMSVQLLLSENEKTFSFQLFSASYGKTVGTVMEEMSTQRTIMLQVFNDKLTLGESTNTK